MARKMTVTILGLGDRGLNTYASIIQRKFPGEIEIAAVADIRKERVERAKKILNLREEQCFDSADALFAQGRLSDVIFICSQDQDHVPHAMQAIKAGYDILMEKPISPDFAACEQLLEAAEAHGTKVCVCHVLRYTPFYSKIRELLKANTIGRVMTVHAREDVGYFHQAHSFVRGNWRRSEETSPMILAKCCHDMDLFVWLTDSMCQSLSSFGDRSWFRSENAPSGSALRCMDGCTVREACPYDCEKVYITNPGSGISGGHSWPAHIVVPDPTPDTVREALKTGPYGRCVYHCDNTVVDHQIVNMQMENGVLVSFSMCAFGNEINRFIKVSGTLGEIEGDLNSEKITVRMFGGETTVIDLREYCIDFEHHGGGDTVMVKQFRDYCMDGIWGDAITSLRSSIESHRIADAAEKSRLAGGALVHLHGN